MWRKLDCHCFGEALHRVLASAVDAAAGRPDVAHLRRYVDDRAGTLCLDQAPGHRLRHEEGGAHVEGKDGVEILDLDVHQMRRAIGAGIVDEHVERFGCRHGAAHRVEIGNVELKRVGLVPARANGVCRGLDLRLRARNERHMRAGLRQRRSCREPDAAPAAGDQRALAVETERRRFGKLD